MSLNSTDFGLTTLQVNSGFSKILAEKFEAKIARFERVGMGLFGVANCFVTFGRVVGRSGLTERSITEMEAAFSDEFPLSDEVLVLSDLNVHGEFGQHRFVAGPPMIRFFASFPVYGQDGKLVACLRLLDYQPHIFDDEQRLLLADLAIMVERELALSAVCQNQLELMKQNRRLKRDTLVDPLLGTWNKPAIIRSLRLEMERCANSGKPMSLLFLLPDQIAELRARHGMVLTDQILVRMVSRIRSCIRPFDALGRFDNDQFLIVLPGASRLVVMAVAERIRLSVMMHSEWIENAEVSLTVCVGLASTDVYPDADPEILISLAEKALLSAKRAGNNTVVQATPGQPDMMI
jgi:diguanylate cyclase (GGDEF)-like protein